MRIVSAMLMLSLAVGVPCRAGEPPEKRPQPSAAGAAPAAVNTDPLVVEGIVNAPPAELWRVAPDDRRRSCTCMAERSRRYRRTRIA